MIKGWVANQVANMNKTKVSLSSENSGLEEALESRGLSDAESERFKFLGEELENCGD